MWHPRASLVYLSRWSLVSREEHDRSHKTPWFAAALLYRAPELLRASQLDPLSVVTGSQKGDIYSFGVVLYELHARHGPFGEPSLTPTEVLLRVIRPEPDQPPFRYTDNLICRVGASAPGYRGSPTCSGKMLRIQCPKICLVHSFVLYLPSPACHLLFFVLSFKKWFILQSVTITNIKYNFINKYWYQLKLSEYWIHILIVIFIYFM